MLESQIIKQTNDVSQLILASSSPRRKELVALLDLSLPVSVFSVEIDEHIIDNWQPAEAVEQLSIAKAKAVFDAIHNENAPSSINKSSSILLAADTVVALEGNILGKPANRDEALKMLTSLQGKIHEVYTGVALMHTGTGELKVSHRSTKVKMRDCSKELLQRYVATGECDDKAGAYGIQGKGANLVECIEGCYFNVVGLPITLVAQMLEYFQVEVIQSNIKN